MDKLAFQGAMPQFHIKQGIVYEWKETKSAAVELIKSQAEAGSHFLGRKCDWESSECNRKIYSIIANIIADLMINRQISSKILERLGRKWEYYLYPFSYGEMVAHQSLLEERLKELVSSYLYKDILTWERIQKPDKMEKAFIVFRIGSLSRNLRNELKKSRKIYFYDNGLRNAVISQFSPAGLRQDIGALWENFMMSERVKLLAYQRIQANQYFWRTHAKQEIDYIEERNGIMKAYEFKWNPKAKAKIPLTFLKGYPEATAQVITPDNMDEFLSIDKPPAMN